jgi:hypothetical protein
MIIRSIGQLVHIDLSTVLCALLGLSVALSESKLPLATCKPMPGDLITNCCAV